MDGKPGFIKLGLSIFIDLVGVVSYSIPGLAETTDIVWAPISGLLIFFMYGAIPGFIGFAEEALPGTDFIPTATLTWIYKRFEQ